MEDERVLALQRLSTRLAAVYQSDPKRYKREGCWSQYLVWFYHDLTGQAPEEAPGQRASALFYLDKVYTRNALCDDLTQLARRHGCDMFDIVLLMPTIVEDLIELRARSKRL